MDGAAGGETKLLRKSSIDGDGASFLASVPPVEQQQKQPAPPLPAVADGSAAAQSCGEEDDDEQVERFYALLANIRALRGLYGAGDGGGGSGSAAGLGRKRARETEAAWRPAFRMEDFEEEVCQGAGDARCAAEKQDAGAGGVRRPAAGAAPPTSTEDDEVAEARGRKFGRRVAAQA